MPVMNSNCCLWWMAYVMPLLPVMPNFNSNLSNATAYMLLVMIFSIFCCDGNFSYQVCADCCYLIWLTDLNSLCWWFKIHMLICWTKSVLIARKGRSGILNFHHCACMFASAYLFWNSVFLFVGCAAFNVLDCLYVSYCLVYAVPPMLIKAVLAWELVYFLWRWKMLVFLQLAIWVLWFLWGGLQACNVIQDP